MKAIRNRKQLKLKRQRYSHLLRSYRMSLKEWGKQLHHEEEMTWLLAAWCSRLANDGSTMDEWLQKADREVSNDELKQQRTYC